MKHAMIKCALTAACALLFAGAAFGAPLAIRNVSADEPQNIAEVDGTEYETFEEALAVWLEDDKSTLTLLQDATTDPIMVEGSDKILDLKRHALSLKEEASGSLLKVDGALTVKDGTLTGGKAERGGGVYVDVLGNLTLENCTVSGNAAPQGGGVFVTGTITLSGNTVVENNTDGNGNASNIFLSPHNKILLNDFTGRAGVTVTEVSASEPFAAEDEGSAGAFFSDDKRYITEGVKLKTAPLATITAVYENDGKVFPTTPLEELKQFITVSGLNVNGVTYTGTLSFELSGILSVGTSALTVTATGEGGETARTQVSLEVSKPTLRSIEVIVPEYPPKVYFDSPLSALTAEGGYAFRGLYDNGDLRFLSPAGEGVEDGYILEGDLTKRTAGKAEITVRAGNVSATFEAEVSKRTVWLTQADIVSLSVPEGEPISPRQFVPVLPEGVEALASVEGEGGLSQLSPGVYEVTISFVVTDEENYEAVTAQFVTCLTVLRRELVCETAYGSCTVSGEQGLLPAWSLRAEEITDSVEVRPEGSLEAHTVYEITLEEKGMAVEEPGPLTVRLSLGEELKDKEVSLFLLQADGSLVKVDCTRGEDGLTFAADSLVHARYVIAVETASQVYVILSVVFVVACLLGVAAVFGYLAFKRKRG